MRRYKKSKFDPYINEITKYVIAGMTVREIAELVQYHFDDVVDESAVYSFMRSRGIQSRVTMGGANLKYNAPKCNECSNCLMVLNTNETEVRMCLPAKRMIRACCTTSPMWCEKRGDTIASKEKMDTRRV